MPKRVSRDPNKAAFDLIQKVVAKSGEELAAGKNVKKPLQVKRPH